jgi:hypothetical protein
MSFCLIHPLPPILGHLVKPTEPPLVFFHRFPLFFCIIVTNGEMPVWTVGTCVSVLFCGILLTLTYHRVYDLPLDPLIYDVVFQSRSSGNCEPGVTSRIAAYHTLGM